MRIVKRGNSVGVFQRWALSSLLLLVAIGSAWIASQAFARPGEPDRNDRRIAIFVSALMDRNHLSEHEVNDEISKRTLNKFIETLDPRKLFFLQSDVDEFAKEKFSIDDYVKSGDLGITKKIYDRFLQRVQQRTTKALEYVEQEHDFTVDETMIRDPEEMEFVTSEAEANERWRKWVKYDLLTQIADDMTYEEARERMQKRYQSIRRNWEQTDNDELLELFLSALTMSFDPHSSYMSPSTLENFTIQMRLELNGIGASLESRYGETIVRRIVPGGAAEKDGRLKIDDVIVGVAQEDDEEFTDIVGMKINDVVQLIRGKPDTVVRLEVIPADKSGRKIYDITRARIELKDSEARSAVIERPLEESEEGIAEEESDDLADEKANEQASGQIVHERVGSDGKRYKIGVISLPSFYMDMEGRRSGNTNYKSTTADVRRLLEEFNEQGVDLVVMDLRFNGGGSLPEAVSTTGLFIDKGPVVQVKGPDGRIQPYPDEDPGMVWSGPLMVLINKFSASASEIFAGAIQDYGRGIVVGDHSTHGKGTVQQLTELGPTIMPIHNPPNYGALKLTIQQFYRPGGDSTQSRGVLSDIELPYRTTHWKGISESDLDYALEFDRVMPLPHDNYRGASAQIIQELQERCSKRINNSEFFQAEQRKIERYLEREEEPTVTLNKEKYLAERAEINSEKDQQEIFDSLQDNDGPVFPKNPYNEEVLSISVDYLELLGQNRIAVAR